MEANIRRCIACRKTAPKQAFWRIVKIHDSHKIVLDEGMGRSAYLCPQEACLKTAQKKKRIDRALKATVPDVVYYELMHRLTNELCKK